MVNIKIGDVTIALTKDQLDQIDAQRNKITNFKQVKSYEIACNVLGIEHNPLSSNVSSKIKTIARAINSLIDKDTNFPNWGKTSQYKYFPYFEYTTGLGWCFDSSYYRSDLSHAQVAFLKTEEASNFIGTEFIGLYTELLNEKY